MLTCSTSSYILGAGCRVQRAVSDTAGSKVPVHVSCVVLRELLTDRVWGAVGATTALMDQMIKMISWSPTARLIWSRLTDLDP